MRPKTYAAEDLAQVRRVQALAFGCLQEVAAALAPGHTEREAVAMIEERLRAAGMRSYFHVPFAWFGDRTAFTGVRTPLDFFPTTRELEPGTAVVLDVAPKLAGATVPVAYSFCCGDNPEAERAAAALEPFRALIIERVNRGDAAGEVYRAVEDLLVDLGYRNCHRRYPFGLLGHRVDYVRGAPRIDPRVFGMSLTSAGALVGQAVACRLPHRLTRRMPGLRRGTPFVNVGPGSEERIDDGLWAFEPHISRDGVGAKFKELLVVGRDRARWLDDTVPHVRRWRETD